MKIVFTEDEISYFPMGLDEKKYLLFIGYRQRPKFGIGYTNVKNHCLLLKSTGM